MHSRDRKRYKKNHRSHKNKMRGPSSYSFGHTSRPDTKLVRALEQQEDTSSDDFVNQSVEQEDLALAS